MSSETSPVSVHEVGGERDDGDRPRDRHVHPLHLPVHVQPKEGELEGGGLAGDHRQARRDQHRHGGPLERVQYLYMGVGAGREIWRRVAAETAVRSSVRAA